MRGTAGRSYAAKSRSYKARSTLLGYQRGYLRRGGYYGRFSRAAGNELKFYDETKSATAVTTTGAVLESSMNNIPEGTGQSERLGRKCTVTQAFVRGTIRLTAPGATSDQAAAKVRFVVALDKQANGATATWSGAAGPFEATEINSFRNLENSSRFRILHDKTYTIRCFGGGSTAVLNDGLLNFEVKCPKLNIPLEFSGATGGLTEIRSNNLVTMAITDEPTNQPTIAYTSRLRYKDN